MQYKNESLRIYPVLLPGTHDYENSRFFANDVSMETNGNHIVLSASIVIENGYIAGLVNNGGMKLCCIVDCPSTKYREVFEIKAENIDDWKQWIPSTKLNDTVEVMFAIVAMEDIVCPLPQSTLGTRNYNDSDTVYFPKYAPVAYSSTHRATLKKSETLDDKSICIITEDKESEYITYRADCEQINILVPSKEYRMYISMNNWMVRTKHAALIAPVLVEIISEIQSDMREQGASDYEQYAWFKSMENKLKEFGYKDLSDDNFVDANSFMLAQKILGNATQESFEEIVNFLGEN